MKFDIDDDDLDQEENLEVSEADFFAELDSNITSYNPDDLNEPLDTGMPTLEVQAKTSNTMVAGHIVNAFDSLATFGLSTFVAKDPKLGKELKAPAEAKKEMTKLLALMLPESGDGKIPPWALLALIISTTYGQAYMKASHFRKEQAELEELRAFKEAVVNKDKEETKDTEDQ